MTGTEISASVLKIVAAAALLLAAYGIVVFTLAPEPMPDLIQGLSVQRNPAEWDQVSSAMTERIRQEIPLGSKEEDVAEMLGSQGFKAVGPSEDKAQRFLFERQDFPCVERFLIQLTFDDAHRLQDVLGRYGSICPS